MSSDFSTIYSLIKTTSYVESRNQMVNAADKLQSQLDAAVQRSFLDLAEQYRFAFNGLEKSVSVAGDSKFTVSAALVALMRTASAMDAEFEESNLNDFVENLSNKIARQGFCLLEAMYRTEDSYKKVRDRLQGIRFSAGVPMLVEALKDDTAIANRVYLKTDGKIQSRLRGKGYFPAPGFLDECSPKLMVLDLSSLWITYLLPSLSRLNQLVSLDLSNNYIKRLPFELGKLKQLQVLNLSKNSTLKEIPEFIGGCKALVKLRASETSISELPNSLVKLENLKEVDVRGTSYDPNKSSVYVSLIKKGVDVEIGLVNTPNEGNEGNEANQVLGALLPMMLGMNPGSMPFSGSRPS